MARCSSCNKFVATTLSDDIDLDSELIPEFTWNGTGFDVAIQSSVELVKTCDECGDTVQSANVELDEGFSLALAPNAVLAVSDWHTADHLIWDADHEQFVVDMSEFEPSGETFGFESTFTVEEPQYDKKRKEWRIPVEMVVADGEGNEVMRHAFEITVSNSEFEDVA